ncbi:MAG: hypothetical protein U9M97_04705 [Candidatus Hadarchaeota archaeon]|nr:hypothetical protein [Candidatus Hadarchaeota archaeon]
MEEKGVGYIADVIFFALMIAFASSLLIGMDSAEPAISSERYAPSLARDTLLTLQQATVDELGGISYELELPISWSSERRLRHKTLTQLFIEDALLNYRLRIEGGMAGSSLNHEFDDRVRELLESTLDRLLAGRFSYRLSVQMMSFERPSGAQVFFSTEVEDFENGARQLCSESIEVGVPVPVEWFGGVQYPGEGFESRFPILELIRNFLLNLFNVTLDSPSTPSSSDPTIVMTLELWSK